MKLKFIVILLLFLIVFQLTDFLFLGDKLVTINSRLFFGSTGNNTLAIILSIILLILLFYFFRKEKIPALFFLIILAGSLSNIFDRIIYGGVIDYMHFWLIPTFNLADIIIVLAFFSALFFDIKKNHRA
jgi:lipoprotein signal peptidase